MFNSFKSWFKALSLAGKVGLIGASALVTTVAASVNHQSPVQHPLPSSEGSTTMVQPTVKPVAVVSHKTDIVTKPIAFTTTTVDDPTLASGSSKIQTVGVNGVETITYDVTYTNGSETGRKIVSDLTTTEPVAQVVAHGTYVPQPTCPNGTYVNSIGNTVCRPYTPSGGGVPAGATARCRDGSYSFSQSRRGTCSYHGGVAEWL